MEVQGGARGFGENAGVLMVVASNLHCFFGPHERRQAWIDGGLFAMSLLYSLQSLGLGSCPLHCSFRPRQERAFRKLTGIPASEALIMAIAAGQMPERTKVTTSARRPLDEVLVMADERPSLRHPDSYISALEAE
jgi:nitroreductase